MTTGGALSSLQTRTGSAIATEGEAPASVSLINRMVGAPAGWLAVLVALSTIVRSAIGVAMPSPWILPDEILYSDLAKSIAGGGLPSVRGVPAYGWGVVYPVLIAPAWALFQDPVRAYHAALAINALVMSLAAVPAYLLARMFVSERASFLAAVMTMLVPSMAYTGVLMTENAFYPVFLLSVLLMARSVRRPTIGNQTLALLGLGAVALTRIQGIALVGAYFAAIAVYTFTGARSERFAYLRRLAPTALIALSVSLAPLMVSVAKGDGLFGWLGARSGTFDALHPDEVPEWFAYLLGDLVLYLAVVPIAATVIVIGRGLSRQGSEPVRLFAAVALPTFTAILATVSFVSASVDVDGLENLNERYVFYVVPLTFIGLALWITEGLPRPRPSTSVVILACVLLGAIIPFGRLEHNASFQSVALLPWIWLSGLGAGVSLLVAAAALLCGLVWSRCRPEQVERLWLLAGTAMALLSVLAVGAFANSSSTAAVTFEGRRANWVDDALPYGARAAVIWDERSTSRDSLDPFYPWATVTEFFNTRLGDVYRLGGPTYYESVLPTVPVATRLDKRLTDRNRRVLASRYVLVTCRIRIEGRVIAEAPHGVLQLVEVEPPLRLSSRSPCQTEGS